MLRFAAAVIFTCVGGAVGALRAERLRSARRVCEEIGILISRLEFMVGYRADDVYAICRRLMDDGELAELKFIRRLPVEFHSGEVFSRQWAEAVGGQADMGREESDLLLRIGGILGRSDSSGQVAALQAVRNELDDLSRRRCDEFLKKGRLYRSAGLLMGAMAGIIVI